MATCSANKSWELNLIHLTSTATIIDLFKREGQMELDSRLHKHPRHRAAKTSTESMEDLLRAEAMMVNEDLQVQVLGRVTTRTTFRILLISKFSSKDLIVEE